MRSNVRQVSGDQFDLEHGGSGGIVGQRSLQPERLQSRGDHPNVNLVPRGEDDRHPFRMERLDQPIQLAFLDLANRCPPLPDARTNASGRVSPYANQIGGRVRSGSASFSEKPVNGTRHRFSTPSQRRQWGKATLHTLVTIAAPAHHREKRPGHPPPGHCQFSTVRPIGNDVCGVVRKDAGRRRQVADTDMHRSGQFAYRLLTLGDRIQIAHQPSSDVFCRRSNLSTARRIACAPMPPSRSPTARGTRQITTGFDDGPASECEDVTDAATNWVVSPIASEATQSFSVSENGFAASMQPFIRFQAILWAVRPKSPDLGFLQSLGLR